MHALERILTKFENIVSPNVCEELARKSRFVQRSTSRVQGYEFARALMIPNAFLEAETLNSLAVRMQKMNSSCNLSASALAQRINSKAAEKFMKSCLEVVLNEIVKKELTQLSDLPNLTIFTRVLIEDSTKAELHEKLGDHYKGGGGASSKSSVKIDYIFDYLSEKFVRFEFLSGNIPDQSLADRILPELKKNDLVVRDLGYYSLASLKEIEQKEAYWLSRLKSDILVYESKQASEPLDLAKFLEKKISEGIDIIDTYIYIGKEKHMVRLIACLMSEAAVNKRRREANRSAQRTGATISKRKSSLLKFCLFITNIPTTLLHTQAVMAVYRSRWRVELIFKQWKTCLKLHVFKGYNRERFHCLLYGRLIMILLLGEIFPPLMLYAQSLGRELSGFKVTNYLIADCALLNALQEGRIDRFVAQLLKDLPRRLVMDKRKRSSLRCNVREANSYYTSLKTNDLKTEAA